MIVCGRPPVARTVVQRFFDPRPGDAIDDAGDFADELLNASHREILEAVGVRPRHPGESPQEVARRLLASSTKRRRKR
jgi:hypothetical protein